MNFAQAMYREGTHKLTENGAHAYDSTAQGALLDLFSQIGAPYHVGINSCCLGKQKTAYGFKWKYAGEV